MHRAATTDRVVHNRQLSIAFVALCILSASLGGCGGNKAKPPTADSASGAVTASDAYLSQYKAGQFAQAKVSAQSAAARSSGGDRDRAQLFQGMSAHALGQTDEAERTLTPLLTNTDREISGRAAETLGLIAAGRRQHEKAIGLFMAAAGKLSGNEAARANVFAGDELAATGKPSEARERFQTASTLATDPKIRQMVTDRLENRRFAVQIGVFEVRGHADKAASDVRPKAAKLGFGAPLIASRPDAKGKTEYVVRIGPFRTRQAAAEAQGELGSGGVVALTQAD